MRWQQIRERYPHQWLLVEAIEAHSSKGRRLLDELTVVQEYPTGEDAMRGYLDLHRRSPERELYVLHTDRETLDVDEREWLGLRRAGRRSGSRAVCSTFPHGSSSEAVSSFSRT